MLLVIIGKTCSGKDTLVKRLSRHRSISKITTYTTRPPRPGEVNHKTYHFISEQEFKNKINSKFFLEYKKYKTESGVWYYGSAVEDIFRAKDEDKVIILTPAGYKDLLDKNLDVDIRVVYLAVDKETQKKRLKNRGDSWGEANRRIKSDDKDFAEIKQLPIDLTIVNSWDSDIENIEITVTNEFYSRRSHDTSQ